MTPVMHSPTSPIRIALFASGTGSNALALLEQARALGAAVAVPLLICDQPAAPVLHKLAAYPTQPLLLPRSASRAEHEAAILAQLERARIDWLLLAGYMRILSPRFVQRWRALHGGAQQIVNIHPSKLPSYPGLHAAERAWAAGEAEIGVTLHYVDEGMDTGSLIAQETLTPQPGETQDAFMQRLHALEHRLYPAFLVQMARGGVATQRYQETSTC